MEFVFKVQRMTVLDEPSKATVAFADLLVNDGLLIKGLTVNQGENGPFVSVPAKLGKDEKWYDQIEFFDKRVKKQMNEVVLKEYEEKKKKN